VLTTPDNDSGHLTATFDKAGTKTVANLDLPSTTLHFEIVTGHDTLLDAETTDVDGGILNLSHICAGTEKSTPSAPVETASAPVETQPAETQPAETEPAETASVPAETASVPAETASVPVESESPTESLVINPQCPNCPPDPSPSGKVEAATGTPHEGVTPPATDSITHKTNPSNSGWQLVLVALAALIATALVLTPATRRNRR
jgi:hypothetical protein